MSNEEKKEYIPICHHQFGETLVSINAENDVVLVGVDAQGSGDVAVLKLGDDPLVILRIANYLMHMVQEHMGANVEELMSNNSNGIGEHDDPMVHQAPDHIH